VVSNGLFNLVYYLYFELNITSVFIDEVHKYQNWTEEIKNIYDSMPTMNVVFSGSSSLDLFKGTLDLARRTSFKLVYPMNYREYLHFFHNIDIPDFSLEEILQNHEKISLEYASLHKQIRFEEFLQKGQYPYTRDLEEDSHVLKFQNLFDKIIIEDLPVFVNLQTASLDKLRRLLYFIANATPNELSFIHLAKKI
jgi:predicted AAA+ superfamily ATPase